MANFNSNFDFYEYFDANPVQFAAAATFDAFLEAVDTPLSSHLKAYRWAARAFDTLKAGKRTAQSLLLPNACKFSDVFAGARLVEHLTGKHYRKQAGYFIGGAGSRSFHGGGERGFSKTSPEIRSHFGAVKFFVTYVTPADSALIATMNDYLGDVDSFEAIRRDDGILIIARNSRLIGSQYVALLDASENIETLYDADSIALLARERAAALAAWGDSNL